MQVLLKQPPLCFKPEVCVQLALNDLCHIQHVNQLAGAHCAEVERFRVFFGHAVAAAHQAVVLSAVFHVEHVAHLVHHDLAGALKQQVLVSHGLLVFARVIFVTRVESVETEYA